MSSPLIPLAFSHSVLPQFITTARSGSITVVNDAMTSLTGYSAADFKLMSYPDLFDNNSASRMINVRHHNGEKIRCIRTTTPFTHDATDYLITTLTDVRADVLLQERIDVRKEKIVANNILIASNKSADLTASAEALHQESFKLLFNSSSDVLFEYDILSNELILSDAYEKEFGYPAKGSMMPLEEWSVHIYPKDSEAFRRAFINMTQGASFEWRYDYRFYKSDGSVASVSSRAVILRDINGRAYRMIGTMQDLSKQKKLEQTLHDEIASRKKLVVQATFLAKEEQRSDIGRELHDNVNQLLGASKLYIDMAKNDCRDAGEYLIRSSDFIATAIEEIRNLSKKLVTETVLGISLADAIEEIADDLMETSSLKVTCTVKDTPDEKLSEDMKVNLFRIIQEQFNNITKHAAAKKVTLIINALSNHLKLTITDDGKGFDTTRLQQGIGVANIKSRAAHLNGKCLFTSSPDRGCKLTVSVPWAVA